MKKIVSIAFILIFALFDASIADKIKIIWDAPTGPQATIDYLNQNNIEIHYQLFRKTVANDPSASGSETILLDDGDSGTLAVGAWSTSTASGFYGTQSVFSRDPSATYTFQAKNPGRCKVSLWWTQLSSRSVEVPVQIYDADKLLKVMHVNQTLDGGKWNALGTYEFSSYPKVVIVSTGSGSACADAIEFATAPVDFDLSKPIYDGTALEYNDEQTEPAEYLYMARAYYTTPEGQSIYSGGSNVEGYTVKSKLEIDAPILNIKSAVGAIQESIDKIRDALGMLEGEQNSLK